MYWIPHFCGMTDYPLTIWNRIITTLSLCRTHVRFNFSFFIVNFREAVLPLRGWDMHLYTWTADEPKRGSLQALRQNETKKNGKHLSSFSLRCNTLNVKALHNDRCARHLSAVSHRNTLNEGWWQIRQAIFQRATPWHSACYTVNWKMKDILQ